MAAAADAATRTTQFGVAETRRISPARLRIDFALATLGDEGFLARSSGNDFAEGNFREVMTAREGYFERDEYFTENTVLVATITLSAVGKEIYVNSNKN